MSYWPHSKPTEAQGEANRPNLLRTQDPVLSAPVHVYEARYASAFYPSFFSDLSESAD